MKFSTRFCDVRPIHCPVAWLNPSTSAFLGRPTKSALRRIWMARCSSCRIVSRRPFSSSGTWPSSASAEVLGRGEYLKLNRES